MLRRHQNPYQSTHEPSRSKLYESDSEEEELDDYEEEQERLLSEAYGEAEEGLGGRSSGNTSSTTKKLTDAEIASELNKEETKKLKNTKRRVPVLDCKTLTGPKGLIKIRHEFRSYKYRPLKPSSVKKVQWERNVQAAANYLSVIMRAYQDFATTLCPSEHYSDTFYKIHQLGSKKDTKDYLDSMRDDMARECLESIYGREKAEKYIHELEHGLKIDRSHLEDVMYDEAAVGAGTMRLAAMQAYTERNEHKSSLEMETNDINHSTDHVSSTPTENNTTDKEESHEIHSSTNKSHLEESDDEAEFEMDFQEDEHNNNDNNTSTNNTTETNVVANASTLNKVNIVQTCASHHDEESDEEKEFDMDENEDHVKTNDMTREHESEEEAEEEEEEEEKEQGVSSDVDTDPNNNFNVIQEMNQDHERNSEEANEEVDEDMFMRFGQTQETIIHDASQTQQTQDTLIIDSTQNFSATQDTVVETMTPTQDALMMEGSQDY